MTDELPPTEDWKPSALVCDTCGYRGDSAKHNRPGTDVPCPAAATEPEDDYPQLPKGWGVKPYDPDEDEAPEGDVDHDCDGTEGDDDAQR